jgi:hypothetical protein
VGCLVAKNQKVQEAMTYYDDVRRGAIAGGGDLKQAMRDLKKAESELADTRVKAAILDKEAQGATQELVLATASLENAEQANRIRAEGRAKAITQIEEVRVLWQTNQTEENLIALTDTITAIACEQNIAANPFWKTSPSLGANIYYQSLGERQRGVTPNPINNPTQTQHPICLGKYYVWAERAGRPTSDKNKTFTIYVGVTEITVIEDR